MNYLANMTGNKHIKAIAPVLSKLSMGEKMNLLRGKASQDTITKVFKEAPQEQLAKIAKNFDNSPSSVNMMKELAKKIDLKDEVDRNKLTYLAKQANMKDDDIKEILGNLGTNTNANKKVSINDISEIIQKHGEPIKDTEDNEKSEDTEPKKKIKDIDTPYIRDTDIATKLRDITRTIKKSEKGYKISQDDKEKFDRTVDELKNTDNGNEDKDEIDKYLNNISDLTNKIKNDANDLINSNKTIIEFSKYASLFRFCLVVMISLCIFIYIVIVILSTINVIYLLIKIINTIINLFYNTVITNEQTLSYSSKQIVKCTKNNYKYDLFNILAEQQTALTIFNTIIYIIYILMAYVIMYILCVIYVQIMRYTHKLQGTIADIDPKYLLLSIIGILLIFSVIHLLIYKFLFKNMAMSNYKDINKFELEINNKITNIVSTKYNNNNECSKFFELLSDTSKRNELDTFFSTKVKTIKVDTENNIRKYLMMYNIYMYFEEYLYMNDSTKDKIKLYFGIDKDTTDENENGHEQTSFIGLLDSNERKLLKSYHEELPFHSLIPKQYIDDYQPITEEIAAAIASINKYIIKYSGTFFPFLITCVYIFLICIYNIYTLYIIFKFINETESENIFLTFIYSLSHKYIYYLERLYSFIFNK